MSKTQPARGMRDFLPSDIRKRNFVINIIKEVYESYGFEPLETPAVENIETLMGKYGEEGNQLIFKILKRGEHEKSGEADLALRYDLTVPTARVIANNKNDLPKFFKRYQIQPVWRADRPARGRFREFYQCDVDAIGSKSMVVEAELISAVCEILERLGFEDFEVCVNHRKLLSGVLESAGISIEKHSDSLIALDKLDKIGREGVEKEFIQRGIADESGIKLLDIFSISEKISKLNDGLQNSEEKIKQLDSIIKKIYKNSTKPKKSVWEIYTGEVTPLIQPEESKIKESKELLESYEFHRLEILNLCTKDVIKKFIGENEIGNIGVNEIDSLLNLTKGLKKIRVNPSLARGLSYYTGAIFEIVLTNGDFAGSIGGGGRYDGLIGMFSKEEIPACGFSLGLERIIVVMEERGEFDRLIKEGKIKIDSADVMVTIWNEESIVESLKLASELRKSGLRVLVYPEADKMAKQFKYAGQINVPYVCVLGEKELAENKVALKNMTTGEQEIIGREEVGGKVKSKK